MNEIEIKKFYNTLLNLDNIEIKTALLISLLTGLRRGELAGLRWSDIDFEKKTLTISRSIRYSNEQGYFVKEPKTISSYRTLTLPNILINQLNEYKTYLDKLNKKKGINSLNYLFTDSFGHNVRLDIFGRWMKRISEKAGISKHTLHSLRHTNISIQIAAGIPIVTVANRAGHSKTSTTVDIYAYSMHESDVKAADVIDEMFGKLSDYSIK